ANQRLQQTAQKVGLQIPQGSLPPMKQQELQIYQSLDGQQFDQQFVSCMKAAHAHDICKFDDVSRVAQNDDVKKFARETLPALQQHGQMIEQTATAVGLGSGYDAIQAGAKMGGDRMN